MTRSKIYKLSDDEFKELILSSNSYSDVLRKIDSTVKGNNREVLKRRIKELNIDISHFTTKNSTNVSKYTIDNAFVYGSKVCNQRLIMIMLENDLKEYKCEDCGCNGIWLNNKIILQLHHIDGDNKNNTLDNLQILCPNCHSVTDNFGAKNNRDCKVKNKYIDSINNFKEEKKFKHKNIILSNEELISLLTNNKNNKTKVAKILGVPRSTLAMYIKNNLK